MRWNVRVNLRDHPRMCGEHLVVSVTSLAIVGSSPHVRGAPPTALRIRCSSGIIPACAGSTRLCRSPRRFPRDHPRMCGEHSTKKPETGTNWGSSPHVRGAPLCVCGAGYCLGIIPACAGSTVPCAFVPPLFGDHPRMCGEHTSKIA